MTIVQIMDCTLIVRDVEEMDPLAPIGQG